MIALLGFLFRVQEISPSEIVVWNSRKGVQGVDDNGLTGTGRLLHEEAGSQMDKSAEAGWCVGCKSTRTSTGSVKRVRSSRFHCDEICTKCEIRLKREARAAAGRTHATAGISAATSMTTRPIVFGAFGAGTFALTRRGGRQVSITWRYCGQTVIKRYPLKSCVFCLLS